MIKIFLCVFSRLDFHCILSKFSRAPFVIWAVTAKTLPFKYEDVRDAFLR